MGVEPVLLIGCRSADNIRASGRVPREQAGDMTCTRPQALHQNLLAIRASSRHGPEPRSPRSQKPALCLRIGDRIVQLRATIFSARQPDTGGIQNPTHRPCFNDGQRAGFQPKALTLTGWMLGLRSIGATFTRSQEAILAKPVQYKF